MYTVTHPSLIKLQDEQDLHQPQRKIISEAYQTEMLGHKPENKILQALAWANESCFSAFAQGNMGLVAAKNYETNIPSCKHDSG